MGNDESDINEPIENPVLSDESLLDGIDAEMPRHASKRVQRFEAWHLPRKQLVRKYQWCHEINRLVADWPEGETIKYLSLPGDDLLDIRVIYKLVCQPKNIRLKYLGFNRTAAGDVNAEISSHEVRSLPLIDVDSRSISDDILSLGLHQSPASAQLNNLGPLDVVNLDLCECIAGRSSMAGSTYFDLLQKVISHQATSGRKWLLFLSSSANNNALNDDVFIRLADVIDSNRRLSEEFRGAFQDMCDVGHATFRQYWLKNRAIPNKITNDTLSRCLSVGIGKWLLKMSLNATPSLKMRMEKGWWYSVSGNGYDFISLAFLFEPAMDSIPDDFGLGNASHGFDAEAHELRAGKRILDFTQKFHDPNITFRENPSALLESVQETKDILRECQYSGEDYMTWLTERGVTIPS